MWFVLKRSPHVQLTDRPGSGYYHTIFLNRRSLMSAIVTGMFLFGTMSR